MFCRLTMVSSAIGTALGVSGNVRKIYLQRGLSMGAVWEICVCSSMQRTLRLRILTFYREICAAAYDASAGSSWEPKSNLGFEA